MGGDLAESWLDDQLWYRTLSTMKNEANRPAPHTGVYARLSRWLSRAFGSRAPERVTVDDGGVTREIPGELHEQVRWEDLERVTILTTDEGPFAEDFFFLLHGRDGTGCVVGNGRAVEVGLLDWLQRKLPGLDNLAVVRASGSTDNAEFTVWESGDADRP